MKQVTLILLSLCFSFSVFATEKVTLTTHNLSPYGSYPEGVNVKQLATEQFNGVAVKVVRYAFRQLNIPLEIQVVPWSRAQKMVELGLADGFFAGSQKASRDQFAVMSAVIADQKWNWYLLSNSKFDPEHSDFKYDARVGGFIGSNMLSWMKSNQYNVTMQPRDTEALLKALLGGRVDAVMANNYVMDELTRTQGVGSQVRAVLNKNKPLGVYFSKAFIDKNPKFLDEFNQYVHEYRSLNP